LTTFWASSRQRNVQVRRAVAAAQLEGRIERKDVEETDSRVAELAQELATAINRAEASGRTVMRDYAIDMLRDAVETDGPSASEGTAGASGTKRPLNPLALGIPAFLMGTVLVFLFPIVGLLLFAFGAVACLVGVAMAIARNLRSA
jgi:hypothetical protein